MAAEETCGCRGRLGRAIREAGVDVGATGETHGEGSAERSSERESKLDPGPNVARVPDSHVHDTFDVTGLDCRRCESLLEAYLADQPDVSAASATARNGTVGVHHGSGVDRDDLRETLTALGLVVAPGDEAFASRRAAQFDAARVAVAVLFGLMVAVPYIGVLYPTRVEWLFYDPVTVAYLQSILDSQVATHFFVNLAALSGIAFLVAAGPTIRRAGRELRIGRLTPELAFVASVLGVYAYSTLAAFTGFGGNVHYDLVAYAVAGVTVWRHVVADVDDPVDDASGAGSEGDAVDSGRTADDPVALTDGGR